jgi:hypothetical protein
VYVNGNDDNNAPFENQQRVRGPPDGNNNATTGVGTGVRILTDHGCVIGQPVHRKKGSAAAFTNGNNDDGFGYPPVLNIHAPNQYKLFCSFYQ